MVKLSRNNLKQQQRRRSQNRRGGLFEFLSTPDCAEGLFLSEGKCVTAAKCPDGTHADTNCVPHECVSGTRDGWLNAPRAAACRAARKIGEFTKSKATLAKQNWQKFRYEQCKQYIALYEAAQNSDPQAVAALDALHENAENSKVAQEQAVDAAVAEAVVVAKEEAVAEVQAQTQDMINAAAAAVKEEVRQEVVAEVQAETQAIVEQAAAAATVAANAASAAAEQAQNAATALANVAQSSEEQASLDAGRRSSRRRRY
jgi:hypothetical protein